MTSVKSLGVSRGSWVVPVGSSRRGMADVLYGMVGGVVLLRKLARRGLFKREMRDLSAGIDVSKKANEVSKNPSWLKVVMVVSLRSSTRLGTVQRGDCLSICRLLNDQSE